MDWYFDADYAGGTVPLDLALEAAPYRFGKFSWFFPGKYLPLW